MTIESTQQKILDFLAKYPNEEFKSNELARRLGYQKEREILQFKDALRSLKETGRVKRLQEKTYRHLHETQLAVGKLSLTKQGFGFVTLEETGEDIFIAPRLLESATHGDRVEVSLFAQSAGKREKGDRTEGEVVRVIDRARSRVVGTLEVRRTVSMVVPDDTRVSREVVVAREDLMGAGEGEKVVVEIDSWGKGHLSPQGHVVERLGKAGEVTAEILSVAREFNLPTEFPPEVIAEADAFPVGLPEEEVRRRRDFRGDMCVTIDPDDAKDFDDAVSLTVLDSGDYRLGVHIADVAYYVREGTALDREAFKRATSVYFPNGVIPMLPERLSNGLCSLRPDEDRFAFSAFMTVSPRGQVKDYEITETVIRSKRRFSYEQVQAIVTGTDPEDVPRDIVATVREMYKLSAVLTRNRMKEGSIDFDTSEAKFTFDSEGKPSAIIKKERLESHRLVEEFMLLANRVVAQHIGLAKKEEHIKPFIYRIHDSPDPVRVKELAMFVEGFGFKLNVDGGVTSKALQKLLHDVHGSEVESVINEVALRSMAKAVYSEKNIGHYGLGFDYYTHFTSPIRRYPDTVVHRLLKRYAQKVELADRQSWQESLPAIAKHSSVMERNAMEAERAAVKVMQVEYMKRHLGDEFHAVVSGVMQYGIFVEVTDLLVEGMIHVRDLEGDYYVYDEKKYALIGRRTGKQYRLGDSLEVKVIRVDPEERQIDFGLASAPEAETGHSRRPKRRR